MSCLVLQFSKIGIIKNLRITRLKTLKFSIRNKTLLLTKDLLKYQVNF